MTNPINKLPFATVVQRFSDHGWELIGTEYLGVDVPIEVRCYCGYITKRSLRGIRKNYGCKSCSNRKKAVERRVPFYQVLEAFQSVGFDLLEESYVNAKTPMRCICVCGEETFKTYESIKEGQMCKSCGYTNRKVYYGEENPAYNPKLTDLERQTGRNYPRYKEWSLSVKQRDGFRCKICGSGEQIVSHHKNGYNKFPDLRLEISNGVTLCSECHEDFHLKYGYGDNTEIQFKEYQISCARGADIHDKAG